MGKTSSEAKRRYNAKTYTRIAVDLPKSFVTAFKDFCTTRKKSQAQAVREAIQQYIEGGG